MPNTVPAAGEAMPKKLDMTAVTGFGWIAIDDALTDMADTLFQIINRPQCGVDDELNAAGRYVETFYNFMMEEHDRMRAQLQHSVDEGRENPEIPNRILLKSAANLFDKGGFGAISEMAAKMHADQSKWRQTL